MSQEPGAHSVEQGTPGCLEEESEFSTHEAAKELPGPQDASAAEATLLPRSRKAVCPKHKGVPCECAASENLEKGLRSSNVSVKGSLGSLGSSPSRNAQQSRLREHLGDWFRSHPVLTLLLLIVLLLLVVVFGLSLAFCSGRGQTEIPVTPDTPRLLACPKGWVGYHGLCYFLSKDHRTWDDAQARCSELGASLAVPKDWEMRFLFRLSGNVDHWIGLRREDQELRWEDGSSFNSSVPVLGNAECVFLADNRLRSGSCSNEMPYLCRRAQTRRG